MLGVFAFSIHGFQAWTARLLVFIGALDDNIGISETCGSTIIPPDKGKELATASRLFPPRVLSSLYPAHRHSGTLA